MLYKGLLSVLAVASVLMIGTVKSHASEPDEFMVCDSCSSYQSFEQSAASLPFEEGETYILVTSFENEEIRRFRRYYRAGNPAYGEPGIVTLSEVAVPAETQNNFDLAMQEKSAIEEFFDVYGDVPSNIAGSAYDLGGNTVLQRDVAAYYSSNQSLQQIVGNYSSLIFLVAKKIVNLNLYVALEFEDGTFAEYNLTGLNPDMSLRFNFSRGYDKYGNEVPEGVSDLEGTYRFDSVIYSSFARTVTRFDLVLQGGSIPNGQTRVIDCSIITVGGKSTLDCPPTGYN